jgi:DNA-directed RNA polymerase subunit RPC12/RpoP/uncharacterized membrane protein
MNSNYKCPSCNTSNSIPPTLIGSEVECLKCDFKFIPKASEIPFAKRAERASQTATWKDAVANIVGVLTMNVGGVLVVIFVVVMFLIGLMMALSGLFDAATYATAKATVDTTYNIGLLNERTNYVINANGRMIAGILICGFTLLLSKKSK